MVTETTDSDRTIDGLVTTLDELIHSAEPHDAVGHLALLSGAARVEAQSRILVGEAAVSARSAGATWADIGSALGVSKQAAQKRFGGRAPGLDVLDPAERILGPINFADEMKELALAGRYGWHSVEFGLFYHRVVRSSTQWEHRKITVLRSKGAVEEGWEVIGSSFPYVYLKRDLGVPALEEP